MPEGSIKPRFATLPFVFAQAIFRMLCDAFEEDRGHFVGDADALMSKVAGY